ncbi:MAG: CBS domain-containing protein [Candidatus Bathyarchaeota archaeon]|nr:CBS domain-containing protein [Candidatus Bathyarchaeota archaeon]
MSYSRKNESFRRTLRGDGPVRLKTHASKPREGEIMTIAKRSVVTASLTTSVYDVVQIMATEGFRRIPIVDPGTNRLQGIVTSTDMVNYFGGGEKFQIIQQKFKGSFFKAINESIKSIMQSNPPSIKTTATIGDAIRLMKQHGVGGLPILDHADRVWAIVTERDMLRIFKSKISGAKIADLMTKNVVTATPRTTIFEAERTMAEKSFRRLPIISDGKVVGIVTAMDVVRFFGSGKVFQHLRSGTMLQVLQTPALEIGVKDLITIMPSADLSEAARIMNEKNIGALLVVDDERLVGIITERDFFKLISE